MESERQTEFEPSFYASVSGLDGGSGDQRRKVALTTDNIVIGSGSVATQIPFDDIWQFDVVLLTVEPYWFPANAIAFLPLMYDRPMLRLTVGRVGREIDLRPERRDLAYATFVEFLTKRALAAAAKTKVVVRTAPRSELKQVLAAAIVGSFFLFGWVGQSIGFGTDTLGGFVSRGLLGMAIFVGALVVPVLLASAIIRRRSTRDVTRTEDVFPFIV